MIEETITGARVIQAYGRGDAVCDEFDQSNRRLRAGFRIDAMSEPGWRFVPYFAAAVVWATTEVMLDSVDGIQPPPPVRGPDGNTVDLGLWQAREGQTPWGTAQFRGWGGSSHPDVAVSSQGFSTEAEYLANPKGYVPGRTTRGFLPGPLPAGRRVRHCRGSPASGSKRRDRPR